MGDILMDIEDLRRRIGTPAAPLVFDVRRREAFVADARVLPTARWRDHRQSEAWAGAVPAGTPVVVYCAHGEQVGQSAAAVLRARGLAARCLRGGIEAWRAAGGPTVLKAGWPGRDEARPSRWITRTEPKIDRIACPWFIRRFVDREAEFLFVAADQVQAAAAELGAVPFDIEGADYSHEAERCSFDAFLARFGIEDEALAHLAEIVRGADTGRPELAPEAAGLLAVSLGISALAGDDRGALDRGFPVYDALYAWRRLARAETHGWPPKRAAA